MEAKVKHFLQLVEAQLPEVTILTREEERLIYAHGCYPLEYKWLLQGPYKYLPEAILMPNNTAEVSAIMSLSEAGDVGIIPFGGGSGIVGGSIAENHEVMVDLKRLRHFEINAINCTATGGAGLTGAEFENMLNEAGFTCGQYPQSFQSAVLGGMVSTRAIGTFSTKYGKMDDMVNSMEVVLPNGHILRTHKCPKASTGPELDQLFLGAEGVYGLVTEVEVKIYPVAEKRYFEAYTFPSTEQALTAVRSFVQNNVHPAVVRVYDEEEAIPKIEKYGYETGHVFVVFGYEGLAKQVDLEVELVKAYCEANGGVSKGKEPGYDWFNSGFSTKKMLDHDAMKGGTADAIEVAAPWDCIANVWREMRKALEPLCTSVDCHFSHVYHTGASVYVIFHAQTGGDDFDGEQRYKECLDTAIRTSLANGGNVSHHHGSGKAKAPYLVEEHGQAGVEVMQKIKDALDPKGLVNKGVLGL
ncbi:alkyldihydroxyacetonephosphate synthase [Eubacterium aggregans]|uniref:Alkyldihydroxyacetonephosphate synthase n=1 Tax=Eubacterium aggregans TaxID=81409 RepID=A0A1H3YEB9_9FIRM|nr:FAD-binding oxidoreductase [Eubacterium aggregans]SEA09959.1 alkyldihydroxyacetonephosphate synthase [Eubacterium aggregans]